MVLDWSTVGAMWFNKRFITLVWVYKVGRGMKIQICWEDFHINFLAFYQQNSCNFRCNSIIWWFKSYVNWFVLILKLFRPFLVNSFVKITSSLSLWMPFWWKLLLTFKIGNCLAFMLTIERHTLILFCHIWFSYEQGLKIFERADL